MTDSGRHWTNIQRDSLWNLPVVRPLCSSFLTALHRCGGIWNVMNWTQHTQSTSHRPTDRPTNRPVSQSASQSICLSVCQSVSQSTFIGNSQPGFDLPLCTWSLTNHLNHFRTGQGPCRANLHKWGLAKSPSCDCGQWQIMNNIVDTCPLTKFEGGLNLLHEADDDAVIRLESTATAALAIKIIIIIMETN